MKTAACLVAAAALLAGTLVSSADVVTTKDGLVLEGTAVRAADGSVTVSTQDGEVRLAADQVVSVAPGEGPRAAARRAAAALAAGDVDGHYRLAVALEAQGLLDLARQEYEAVVAADPDHPAARRALGHERVDGVWMTTAQARRRHGLVLYEGQWLLPAEVGARAKGKRVVAPQDRDLVQAMKTAATSRGALREAALLRVARAGHAERVEASTSLLVHPDPRVRRWACRDLETSGDRSALRALIAVSVRDRETEVRTAAVHAAASFGANDVAVPLVRALWSEHPGIVANAATSLAALGDPRTVVYLVKRIVSHGSSPGAYFAHTEETAYIQDFDVEVAQTSFIADPQVGTIQEGAVGSVKVLDAMIEQTRIETVLVGALNGLAKASFKDADEVRVWAQAHAAGLPDLRTPPAADRAAPEPAPPPAMDGR